MNTFCNNTILDKNVTNYFLIVALTAILIYMKNTCEENHCAMQKKKRITVTFTSINRVACI